MNRYIKASSSNIWKRPSDWLDIDSLVSIGDHKFVGLMAVFSDRPSIWHFNMGQAYTVSIDGVATNYASGTAATGSIDFSTVSATTQTSEGFRQVVFEVYPQVSPATTSFTITSTRTPLPTSFVPNWIDIRMSMPNIASMFMNGGTRFSQLRKWTWLGVLPALSRAIAFNSPYLEEVNEDISTVNSLSTYYSSSKLPRVIGNITNNIVASWTNFIIGWGNETIGNISSTSATNCTTIIGSSLTTKTIGNLNFPNATSFSLAGIGSAISIGTVNLSSLSNLTSAFANAIALETLGDITTGTALTNIASVISGNRLQKRLYISNCANVTNTAGSLTGAVSLQELYLGGLTIGITIPPCQMNDTAFANFFTSLGTAAGAQTIVITGNITLSAPTLAIATGKGFTVTP